MTTTNNNEFRPMRKAHRANKACAVCGKPINVGDMTQRVPSPKPPVGKLTWVHLLCGDPEKSEAAVIAGSDAVGRDSEARQLLADLSEIVSTLDSVQTTKREGLEGILETTRCEVDRHGKKIRNCSEAISANVSSMLGLKREIDELKNSTPREVVVKQANGKKVKLDGIPHEIFDRVVALAAARKNIFIPGPTGCGKTHLGKQVAQALDLRFGFVSCSAGMSEGQLTGRMIPTGDGGKFEFSTTSFIKCFEEGGVFLLDEVDAADANVLLIINAALANGELPLPNRTDKPIAQRHKDFVCIAAANTWGTGADRMYVGRNQLDEATLDRFRIGTVPMDYDEALERKLVANDKLHKHLTSYRESIRSNRLRRSMSTRFMIDAADMVANHGWTMKQVDETYFSGWTDDERRKVAGR